MTSPPYGKLRDYNGYTFDHTAIINTLYRVTKPGGVVVWVVADETNDGSESGASFRQALHFKEQGFLLHDTMIYFKNTSSFPARRGGNRYTQIFEYMFVFSKDTKPKTAVLICDKRNRWAGSVNWGQKTHRGREGILIPTKDIKPVPAFSPRNNAWHYTVGGGFGQEDKAAYKHPATFPFRLPIDHINTWSNPGDVVLDPMAGSGTTCIAAQSLGRNYIGVDISSEYCGLARLRLENASKESYEKQLYAEELKVQERDKRRDEILQRLTAQEREILGFPALTPFHGLN